MRRDFDLPIADKFATMDRARALPTDRVVLGFLLGGGGGCTVPPLPAGALWTNFRGKVEYCLAELFCEAAAAAALLDIDGEALADAVSPPAAVIRGDRNWGRTVTTVRETKSPDLRIRFTTCS